MTAKIYITPTSSTELINIGDVSSCKPSHEVKRTPIMDSEKGFRLKTRELMTEIGWQYDATLNEMTLEVLELVNLGNATTDVSQSLISAPTGTASFAAVKYRRAYDLGKESVDTVVVKNQTNTVTYTVDVDYILDADAGIIELKSTGAIAEASTINVTFGCAAKTRSKINALRDIFTDGTVRIMFFDQHDGRAIEIHSFPCQYYITDFGSSDGSKIMEVQIRFVATAKPSITYRK